MIDDDDDDDVLDENSVFVLDSSHEVVVNSTVWHCFVIYARSTSLWSFYVIGQTIIFLPVVSFYLLLLFFPLA